MSLIITLAALAVIAMVATLYYRAESHYQKNRAEHAIAAYESAFNALKESQSIADKQNQLQEVQRAETIQQTSADALARRDAFNNDWMPEHRADTSTVKADGYSTSETSPSADSAE